MIGTIVYLSGALVAYLVGKYFAKRGGHKWTRGDRLIILIFAIFSWAAVLTHIVLFIAEKFDQHKDAKW